MASAPMRSHSAPAVVSVVPDDRAIAIEFQTNFNAGNINDIPVHGICHPVTGPFTLLFYPEDKTYSIAIAVDEDTYFNKWQPTFTRPLWRTHVILAE